MCGLHGIAPETQETCHSFWSMSSNQHPDMPGTSKEVVDQTRFTFDEDRVVHPCGRWRQPRASDRAAAVGPGLRAQSC